MDVLIGWPGGSWQDTLRLGAALGIGYFLLLWLTTTLWAYRDIRSRTRDPASQAVGVAIVGALPLVGIPLYLVVRPRETLRDAYERQLEQEAILSELHSSSSCPNCRRPVQDDFMVCAHCSTNLKAPCKSCGRLLTHAWRACPYCATPKASAQQVSGQQVSGQRAASPATQPALQVEEPPPLDLQLPREGSDESAAS